MTTYRPMADLVCPRDRSPLKSGQFALTCSHGHRYPIVEGVPVLLIEEREQTIGIAQSTLDVARQASAGHGSEAPWYLSTLGISAKDRDDFREFVARPHPTVDPVVAFLVGATNGIMYRALVGRISDYPIPEFRMRDGAGRRLLDVGCNWGRWSVAAARKGYRVVGIDPSLGAVLAARRVAAQLGVEADFVVGDARFLPFADGCFDAVFSYSVIQHFSKADACDALVEAGRVLNPLGLSFIQMPNKFGVRCFYHQARRAFRAPENFEVRYWSPSELRRTFSSAIGPTRLSVDCFFGIGLQASDAHLMSAGGRALIRASEALRAFSERVFSLAGLADSIYLESTKPVRPPGTI